MMFHLDRPLADVSLATSKHLFQLVIINNDCQQTATLLNMHLSLWLDSSELGLHFQSE